MGAEPWGSDERPSLGWWCGDTALEELSWVSLVTRASASDSAWTPIRSGAVARTARHFGYSGPTVYRSLRRFEPRQLENLPRVFRRRADPAGLAPELRRWEDVYNTIQPHQALGYLTQRQFLDRWNEAAPG